MGLSPVESQLNQVILVFIGTITLMLVLMFVMIRWLLPVSYAKLKGRLHVSNLRATVLLGLVSRHGELILLQDGYTPSEARYSWVMGLGVVYSDTPVYGLYTVELPFVAAAHLVGLSNEQKLPIVVDVHNSALEPVALEGDYAQHFALFADKQEQVEARYVFDPKAMAFTIDFCKQFNWEIVGDSLFFLSSNSMPSFELVDQFISEIRPAIDSGKKPRRHSHDLPYVTIQPLKMDCPICSERLQPVTQWLACFNHDGILVTGEQLLKLRQRAYPALLTAALKSQKEKGEKTLVCPHCQAPMRATLYQHTEIAVDVCTRCRYRWLDYKEADEIAGVENALI